MKQQLINFYLDWVNNFLTVSVMAQYYGLTEQETQDLISMGKKYHRQKSLYEAN